MALAAAGATVAAEERGNELERTGGGSGGGGAVTTFRIVQHEPTGGEIRGTGRRRRATSRFTVAETVDSTLTVWGPTGASQS